MASADITITRATTAALSQPLLVDLAVGGTAMFGIDYTVSGANSFTSLMASVIIPANSISVTFTLNSVLDAEVEPDETVVLTIIPTAGISSGTGSVVWVILNDDSAPLLSTTFITAIGVLATGSTTFIASPSLVYPNSTTFINDI
jgi:hypothetical protein